MSEWEGADKGKSELERVVWTSSEGSGLGDDWLQIGIGVWAKA